MATKAARGKRNVARQNSVHVGLVVKQKHVAVWCRKGGNKHVYAIDEDDSENVEEATDNEEDLEAWCFLWKNVKMSNSQ